MYRRIVTLGGFGYTIDFVGDESIESGCGPDHMGCCDHPSEKNPSILIDNGLEGSLRMEIILHEMLHGACPALSEAFVRKTAREMARVLTEEGYERTKT